ncbi:MAG TPA: hypothetical protein P5346_17175, partial [Spirochaetota bacterium]|nr:hypothetical protein [Spirochaetota bacterium]
MAVIKKVEINLDYLTPNRSFIYPLVSDTGERILDERVLLTSQKIKEIREKYGNIVYYKDSGKNTLIPPFRMKIAYNKSREIMEEVSKTQKFSKSSYRETERVIEEILGDLNNSEIEALHLLKDLKSHDEYLYSHSVNVGVLTAVL